MVFPASAGMNRFSDVFAGYVVGVFPASAGMNRSSRSDEQPRDACSPRARG